jgi:hypothetical protein
VGRPGVQAITPESAIMMPESAITMAESAITMPGITDHDAGTADHDGLETVITFNWIPRSRSAGLRKRLLKNIKPLFVVHFTSGDVNGPSITVTASCAAELRYDLY